MTLDELLEQKADLDRQIAQARSEFKAKAIAEVRALMFSHGLTVADLAAIAKRPAKGASDAPRRSVATKFKDAEGNSWSGRGLKPKWLTAALAAGKKIEDFAV